MKNIDQDILAILSRCTIEGNVIKLTCGQLDRNTYTAVNKVLDTLGGTWKRKLQGHQFSDDPTDRFEEVLLTGQVVSIRSEFGFFPTPPDRACRVVDLAEILPGETVLEPEAGQGGLADEVAARFGSENLHCIEILPDNAKVLTQKGYAVQMDDFLQLAPRPCYAKIVMNPPFAKQSDIDHVQHAFKFLKPGGRLVAIMSNGFTFRSNRKSTEFRDLVENHGFYEENPSGSFLVSGTGVNTVTVVLDRPTSNQYHAVEEIFPLPKVA